ncbi:Sensor protein TorS [Planctomycetes bacterium Pan216]|uniref:histidine kinase n=1 Tax=Kolteria novifilia TaxID=2527975 RepID=A0A518B0H3_9BACT|nr:Sensor protein TorS [Planctomycetes bacterium Pan216]
MNSDSPVSVLLVAENDADALAFQEALEIPRLGPFHVARAESLEVMFSVLEQNPVDIVVLDLSPEWKGDLGNLAAMMKQVRATPVVLWRHLDDANHAIPTSEGVDDYLDKHLLKGEYIGRVLRDIVAREQLLQKLEQTSESVLNEVRERSAMLAHVNASLSAARMDAEVANRAKTAFLTNMSNELKTPLTSIMGYTEMLIEGLYGSLNLEQREAIEQIAESGERLNKVVKHLMNLIRLETGTIKPEIEPVLISAFVNDCILPVQVRHEGKGLDVEIDIDEHIVVETDPVILKQVLLHLMSNAVKFTPEGGRIGVRCQTDAGTAIISVWDTGDGIDDERLQSIFDPSQQEENGQVQSGIGLTMTSRLLSVIDSKIEVESRPGMGCCFSFRVPQIEVDPTSTMDRNDIAAAQSAAIPESNGKRVLLIDDDAGIRKLVRDTLRPVGAEVVTCANGADGLQRLRDESFDLILLDLELEGATGVNVIRCICKEQLARHIPIYAFTAYAEREDVDRLFSHGFVGLITKPFDIRALQERIAEIFARVPNVTAS